MSGGEQRVRWLKLATGFVGLALAAQTARLFFPVVAGITRPIPAPPASLTPTFDCRLWRDLPIQIGRTKPFETACSELVRDITGRSHFEKQEPMALVLAWALTGGAGAPGFADWEHFPFILCEHADLRREVFGQADPPAGRFVSPAQLRVSPGFDQLLERVSKARAEHQAQAHRYVGTVELKAEEVGRRLVRYDSICGRPVTRLHANAISGEQFLNLREFGITDVASAEQSIARLAGRQTRDPGILRLVALDPSPRAGWLSIPFVRLIRNDPHKWNALLQEHLASSPHDYLGQAE